MAKVLKECPTCGGEFETTTKRLADGRGKYCSKSCRSRLMNLKHGHCRSKTTGHSLTYRTWNHMQQRCGNPNQESYEHYGGRGIKVCDRWKVFENFLADMGERPKRHSLDRIDVNGDYEPGNCRWATHREQMGNTRQAHRIPYQGKTYCMAALARLLDLEPSTLKGRIERDWPEERWADRPKRRGPKYSKPA